jgi:hypothetical protein
VRLHLRILATAVITVWSAHAATVTNHYAFPVVACPGLSQTCNVFNVEMLTFGTLVIRYDTGPQHCSDVRMHFAVDGVDLGASDWLLGPGVTTYFNAGAVSPGSHTVGFTMEGRTGGCNTGDLIDWSGFADFVTERVPDAPQTTILDLQLGSATLYFQGRPSKTNILESTVTLLGTQTWALVDSLVVTQELERFRVQVDRGSSNMFYRIREGTGTP